MRIILPRTIWYNFSYLCTLLTQPLIQTWQECVVIYLPPYDIHYNDLYYHPCIKVFTIHTTICVWVVHKSQITFNHSVQRKPSKFPDVKRFPFHIAEFSLVVTNDEEFAFNITNKFLSADSAILKENSLSLASSDRYSRHILILDWIVLISFNNVNNTSSTQ